jgi:hypothetical protein
VNLITSTKRVLVIAAVALGLALASPGAAAAHSGPIELDIAGTGDGGLVVSAVYTEDGHTVSQIMNPVATAVSVDGATAGPISLVSSAEGVGLWITESPILEYGDWTVTVSTTIPSEATATVQMTVAELAPPVQADGDNAAEVSNMTSDGGSAWPWVAAVGGLLALLAVAVVLVKRQGKAAMAK